MFTEDNTKEDILKEIKLISTVVIVCTFLMSFASFIMYMFSFSGSYLNNEGVAVFFGMFENRLWGLYNPNTGSTLNCISIIISSIFIVDTNSRKTRVLNIINVVLQYMVLLLTGSRAAYYAVLIILALLVVFAALQKMKTVSFLSISKSLASVVAVVCIFVFGGNILKAGLSYLPGITSNVLYNISTITGSSENQEPPVFEKTELDRIEEVENLDVGFFNGRTEIWGACLKEFAKSPVFGIGKENVIERSIDNLDDDKWKNHFRQGGTHNIYVCLLVSSGVVGFLIIGAFAVIILLKSFKVIVKKYNKINYWFLGATLLCIMFFVTEFVEARILFQVSTFSVIFWIYCGYMYKLAKFEDENNE
jgi:O-antigen ligase